MRVVSIMRYTVKGLSGEPLARTRLLPDVGIPGDRALGLKVAGTPPGWQDKSRFLQLVNTPALARLRLRYHESEDRLEVFDGNGRVIEVRGPNEVGRMETFFSEYASSNGTRVTAGASGGEGPESPCLSRFVRVERERFPDAPEYDVSLLFRPTVGELSRRLERPVEEERFRMNIILDGEGLSPFGEFDLVEQSCRLGSATVFIAGRLPRCSAIHVNPETGERDLDLLGLLEREFGHHDVGVFAKVMTPGVVGFGDLLEPREQAP